MLLSFLVYQIITFGKKINDLLMLFFIGFSNRHVKSLPKRLSSIRTVKLTSNYSRMSNNNQDSEQHAGTSNEDQNNLRNEPIAKHIKVDSPININDGIENTNEEIRKDLCLKSIVTIRTTAHDRELSENRQALSTSKSNSVNNFSSHSRLKSKDYRQQKRQRRPSDHLQSSNSNKISSSDKKSNKYVQSLKSSFISRRTSSNDKHFRRQQMKTENTHQYKRRKSSDLSNHYYRQYSDELSETSHQNSLSSTYYQRYMDDFILSDPLHDLPQGQPICHRRFNYNHQSVADHRRFANSNSLLSSTSAMDLHYPESFSYYCNTSPTIIRNRK